MTEPLTALEQRVYHYLLDFLAENTYQPSIRDIGKRFRIKSTKTVSDLLHSIAAKGYIERDPTRSRGVRLLGFTATRNVLPVPFYGRIHAGEPALLAENRVRYITMDRCFTRHDRVFFLKVVGESMIGKGIMPDDYIMVDPDCETKDGDVVVARLGGEATVKTLTHRDGITVLVPANPAEREIVVKPDDEFALLGVVCGVFRPSYDGAAAPAVSPN